MDKLLLNNIEAECGVLGSIIIDPEAIVQVADFLSPDDFYRDSHRIIFEVITRCYERGEPADFITICDELERRQKLEHVGGASYITSLINEVPTSGNVEYYGRIVERVSILRQLIKGASKIAALAYEDGVTTEEAIQKAQTLLYDIAQRRKVDRLTSHREGLSEYMNTLSDLCDRREEGTIITGVPTGFTKLDIMTGGLQRGDLVVIAARPSVGKSSLALNIAKNVIGAGYNSIIFSLEMAREQLWQRLLAEATSIDQARLRIGNIFHETFQMGTASYDGEWPLIAERVGELVGTPGTLFVDDSTGLTPLDMRTRAQKVQAQNGLDLIVVDYLQLAKATRGGRNGGYENRVQEISSITKDLKALARDLNVPVLALAQLSRAAEGIEPQLHHLKECVIGSTRLIDARTGRWVAISDVKSGDEILAMDGQQKIARFSVADVWSTGVKPVYTLKTRTGKSITATENHPFFTGKGWRPFRELQVGDCIATAMNLPSHGEQHEERADLCRLLGYLVGDGAYQHHTSLSFISSDPETFQDVKTIVTEHFPTIHMYTRPKKGRTEECYFTWTGENGYGKPHGNPLREWLRSLDLVGQRDRTKHVPDWVFTAGEIGIRHFLAGYLSSDGCVKVHNMQEQSAKWSIQFDTVSYRLAVDIQALLLRLGIVASVNAGSWNTKSTRPIYRVQVAEKVENLRRFALLIPAQGKKGRLLQAMIITLPLLETNISFFGLPKELTPLVQQASHWHYRNYGKKQNRTNVLELARETQNETLEMWATSDLLWEEIKSIEADGEEEVFDIHVPDAHNFIANGIIAHNSGSIEEDSDVVGLMWLTDAAQTIRLTPREVSQEGHTYPVECKIAKQRKGPVGPVPLRFVPWVTRFEER